MDLGRLRELSSPCRLCPRECLANRAEGKFGRCGVGLQPLLASFGPHFGEESCLVGRGGSGTIFLGGCNLLCLFCQNSDISHGRTGRPATAEELAGVMQLLEGKGCENINLVTPTHFAPELAEAVELARARGLAIPLVWNCGGYESVEALRALEGLVDIYMPDIKTLDPNFSRAAFGAPDYPERVREALIEMQKQVGDLVVKGGVAVKGLLVRHLVMPGMVEDSLRIIEFLAEKVSRNAYVNVMGQYRPCYRARELPGMDRRPYWEEIESVRAAALRAGLRLAD